MENIDIKTVQNKLNILLLKLDKAEMENRQFLMENLNLIEANQILNQLNEGKKRLDGAETYFSNLVLLVKNYRKCISGMDSPDSIFQSNENG